MAKDAGATPSRGTGQVAGKPQQEVRSDPQPALSVERSLVTRGAARWFVQPVAPPRDFSRTIQALACRQYV